MFGIRLFTCCLLFTAAALASDLKLIVQSPSGARVAGVQVALFRQSDHSGVRVETTSGDGTATIPDVPDGDYRAVILAPGFAEQSLDVSIPQASPAIVELKLATPMQTVVVSATATPNTIEQSATSVDLLTAPQLTLLNPVAANDALRYIPGAIISTSGRYGSQSSLFVRGGESNYNKVLVDGVPVNDPGGFFDFGVVPLNSIERLEVARGAESTIYGSDAMTSTVQLWTATGDTRAPEVRFGADGGTFATAHGYASVAGARGIFDYNLFADQFNTTGQGINDTYSNSLQGGNIGVRLTDRLSLRLRLRHSNNRTGIQSNWWFNANPLLSPDSDQYARQNNFLASANLTVSGPGAWQHQFSGFEYNHVRKNLDNVFDPGRALIDDPFENLSKYNRAGFSYQGIWSPRPWAQTTLGYTFEDENGFIRSSGLSFGFPYDDRTHGLRRNHYLFGQENFVWKRVSTLVGVGYVNNESFGNKVVPRASAFFLLFRGGHTFSGTRLRAGYSEGIKEPSFEQSFGITGSFITLPNPNLKPEQNRSIEAGVEQSVLGNRFSLSAVYYNNLFRNQIQYQFNSVDFTSQYVNFNRALAHGAEVELRGQLATRLSLLAGYTYTSTQILKAPACDPNAGCDPLIQGVGAPLLRRPHHAGNVLLTYSGSRWGASVGAVAVGRRPDSDFLFGLVPPIYHAAGYGRVDLGGWYAVNRHLTAYANLYNATNNHYNEVLGYPALKANFRAGLRFRFGGE